MGILNNKTVIEETKKETKQYIGQNNNGEVDPTGVWDALKVVVRGRLISKTTGINKRKMQIYENCSERLKELEK